MKKRIVHVSLLHNAKLMAAIYFLVALPLAVLMSLPVLMHEGIAVSLFAIILMPVLYMAIGFVFTLFGAWVYNVVAARIGGFEFTTAEVSKD
jgi:hypothetical protein